MSAVHIAIVNRPAAEALLAGRKCIESRFSRRRRPPIGYIDAGDITYFKFSGGSIIGRATVSRLIHYDNLTPARIDSLRRRFNRDIVASFAYWRARRHCRHGVLIWLADFCGGESGPAVPRQFGTGWVIIRE